MVADSTLDAIAVLVGDMDQLPNALPVPGSLAIMITLEPAIQLPDPDPFDWFRDGDMKAVCLEVNGVIEGSLERPSECTNICKPLYCPNLGRELSEEEKKTAAESLKWAKKRMKQR